MSDGLPQECDHAAGCITCGDEAVEMEVVKLDRARDLALCALRDDPAKRESVEVALVHPVDEGDRLLVHAGTAIAHAAEEAAA